jgi:hypothetical protein
MELAIFWNLRKIQRKFEDFDAKTSLAKDFGWQSKVSSMVPKFDRFSI